MEAEDLIALYPHLFHMAEGGSWPSIERYGLLSTKALLDLFEVSHDDATQLIQCHRPECVPITHDKIGAAVLRDQKPMDDRGLIRALERSGMIPRDWYTLLNQRVFFWLTRDRLITLLNARAYKSKVHTVLTVDTAPLVRDYRDRIELSPMNSGCTKPFPHPRGRDTFRSIADYPFSRTRQQGKRSEVVELTVSYAVPNIRKYVLSVDEMRGSKVLRRLYSS